MNNNTENIVDWLSDLEADFDPGLPQAQTRRVLTQLLAARLWSEVTGEVFDTKTYQGCLDQLNTELHDRFGTDLGELPDSITSNTQKYKATLEAISQRKLSCDSNTLHFITHVWKTKAGRKSDGQFPTPPLLLRFAYEVYPLVTYGNVGDLSGATGLPLIVAASQVSQLNDWKFFFGERDPELATIALCALLLYRHPESRQAMERIDVYVGDALLNLDGEKLHHIFGNPPYSQKVKDREILDRYATGRDVNVQLSQFLHAECYLRRLHEGGTCTLILDSGSVDNPKYKKERRLLASLAALELVVELPSVAMRHFAGTTFKNTMLFFRKTEPSTTRFEQVKNVGYDAKGYFVGDNHFGTFDCKHETHAYRASDLPQVVESWTSSSDREPDSVKTFPYDAIAAGNWSPVSLGNITYSGDRLGDVSEPVEQNWGGVNQLNPTVCREFRILKRIGKAPKSKTRMLAANGLLMSKILQDDQTPACAEITGEFVGAGVTSENYIIHPIDAQDTARIWYLINFDNDCNAFLQSHCRGIGPRRIHRDDLLRMPVRELSSGEYIKAKQILKETTLLARLSQHVRKTLEISLQTTTLSQETASTS